MLPTVDLLADHLTRALSAERYADEGDPTGVWVGSGRPVRRLGLRVEAGAPPYAWADTLDALLIHRPFGLWPALLPTSLGVLAYHRALDDRATLGYAPPLAHALGLVPEDRPPMQHKGRAIGLVAASPEPVPFEAVRAQIAAAFGGLEAVEVPEAFAPAERVRGVALMGAMTVPLVAEAAERGARVYVTGQLRTRTLASARDAGLAVLAVGHARAEAWGLRYVGRLVRERWPEIALVPSGPGFE